MYYPNLKTSDAELRAVRNLRAREKTNLTPIFELTRSRITKNLPEGSLTRRLDQVLEAFGDFPYILDLCTQTELMNSETLNLFDESGGYINWIEFLDDYAGLNVTPCLLYDDQGSKENFQDQARELANRYGKVCLRISASDELALQLLNWTAEVVPASQILVCALTFYLEPGRYSAHQNLCADFMRDVVGNRRPAAVMFPSSSFPRYITDLPNCDDAEGSFQSRELELEHWLTTMFPNQNIEKSDFASVHPIRYPSTGGSWIPRIDIFNGTGFSYVRTRRDEGGYEEAAAGISAAQLARTPNCWGREQIELARIGTITGASPSYWISVRINCWMTARAQS